MGFHQFGSMILICPRRVPKVRFLRRGFFVRTMSTTGTPLRQIVTDSPSSTALISSGSLFLASATLNSIAITIATSGSYVKKYTKVRQPGECNGVAMWRGRPARASAKDQPQLGRQNKSEVQARSQKPEA